MRKLVYLCVFIFLFGCGNDPEPTGNPKVEEVQRFVTSGKWQVVYFFNTDKEETGKYSQYTFQFLPNGSLAANDGPASLSGGWSVMHQSDASGDSREYADIDFNISFTTVPVLGELSDDWEIISASNTKIELRNISGGNGAINFLTFQKV